MYYYQPIHILGAGSMGSVASKCETRTLHMYLNDVSNTVTYHLSRYIRGQKEKKMYLAAIHGLQGFCFSLPFFGDIQRNCTGQDVGHKVKRGNDLFEETPESYSMESSSQRTRRPASSIIRLARLLIRNRNERPTATQALQEDWIRQNMSSDFFARRMPGWTWSRRLFKCLQSTPN